MSAPEPLLNVKQAAAYLGCATNTVYGYIRSGLIPFCRVGKFYRFDRDVLTAWLRMSALPNEHSEAAHD